ncbi:MAG: spore gernimation protein [Firmicutes bacterium HGW-Firmicutes-16]|nr:MAG: spore gernimation protein [Firmicutes bacterium HGW-Firmicutes-16]
MKLEKGVITNTQLIYLILSFLESMVISINFSYGISKQDTWIAVLAAFVITIPIMLGYTAIAKSYPGKNLIQINDEALGPYVGKLFSALYIWFLFELMIHYAYFFNSFWITYIMTETPRLVFVAIFILVSAFAVWSGIETIARCSVIFTIIVSITVVFVISLLLKDMKIVHFLPILDLTPKDFIQSVHIILTIQFCDLIAFLMIFPYTKNNKAIRKPMLLALCLSTLMLLIVVLVNTAVMGVRITNTTSVSFAITREIDIGNVLTRLDVLVALTLLATVFMKVSVFYYTTVLGLAQLLGLRSYKPLIVPIGLIAIAISANLYPSDMEQVYAGRNIWPFNAMLFEIILPLITLITIALRNLFKDTGGENE